MSLEPHAFIAMPFGSKLGANGRMINSNRVWCDDIKRVVEARGTHGVLRRSLGTLVAVA